MANATTLPLAQGLKNVFTDEKYSDLSITCGDFCWKVHKLVLCTQSDFFSTACDGEFKEAKERKIDLSDEGRHVVSTMLHYLYHFDFDDDHHVKHAIDPTILDVRMIMAGDKYFIERLRDLGMEKLKARVNVDWNKAVFAEAITMAYSNATASAVQLRSLLVDVAQKHADVLFTDIVHLEFQKAAREQAEFLFDYSKATAATVSAKKFALEHTAGIWYQRPGDHCKTYDCVFKVGKPIPRNWVLNCPLKCNMNKSQEFWKGHVKDTMKGAVSQLSKEG